MRYTVVMPVLLIPLLLGGCGKSAQTAQNNSETPVSASSGDDAAHLVRIGAPYWSEAKTETEVLRQILTDAGYQVKITNLGVPLILQGMCDNQIDYWVDAWVPSNNATLKPYYDKGCISKVNTTLTGAQYDITVPDYVYNAGVHSIGDLNKFANKFGQKMYGIEASSAGNKLMKAAIAKNDYDLKGWTIVESSEASMLSAVKNAVNTHSWIAFFGYKPHWMNRMYHIKYLDDPLHVWGTDYHADGIARKGYIDSHPNVGKFLGQVKFDVPDVSEWTYEDGIKHEPVDQIASKWIASHLKTVGQWLNGVKTADGKSPAIDAVRAALHNS